MAEIAANPAYPLLFSEWQIRSTPIANRVVFACGYVAGGDIDRIAIGDKAVV